MIGIGQGIPFTKKAPANKYITEAFLATTGDVLNDSLNIASSGDNVEKVLDESGNERNILQGTSSKQGVLDGKFIDLDGSDDIYNIDSTDSDNQGLIRTKTAFICAADLVSSSNHQGIWGILADSGFGFIEFRSDDRVRIFLRDSNVNNESAETSSTISTGKKVITAIYDPAGASSFRIRVNGIEQSMSVNRSDGANFDDFLNPSIVYGRDQGSDYFEGKLDPRSFCYDNEEVDDGTFKEAEDFLINRHGL